MTPWVQVDVQTDASGAVQVGVPGATGGRSVPARGLALADRSQIEAFGRSVLRAAQRKRDLSSEQWAWARELYTDLTAAGVGQVIDLLRGEGRGRLLLRLMVSDPQLRSVPWEAMRGPGAADGPLACNTQVQLVRGIFTTEPAVPREVRGAVRILAVAPEEFSFAVTDLGVGLEPLVQAGQVEWLAPAIGPAARWGNLLQRLHQAPRPHVLHFVCHGRVRDGRAEILLEPDEGRWLAVDVLAAALAATVAADLRLVYLESCSGAEPGPLLSAAELLTTRGATAAIAHLWTVEAAIARTFANTFYGALTGPCAGDVAASTSSARLGLAGLGTAEFLCPVLYLRGADPVLFDFSRRAASQAGARAGGPASLSPELVRRIKDFEILVGGKSTLLVGDLVEPDGVATGRDPLARELGSMLEARGGEGLPQLMQRYEMAEEREELKAVVQQFLEPATAAGPSRIPRVIDGLTRVCGPGLVVTLLWLPFVEESIAFHHPDREVLVFQPLRPDGLARLKVFRRAPNTTQWERLREPPARLDFTTQSIVVRLHGGYNAGSRSLLGDPVLTEDDHLANIRVLDSLPEQMLGWLRSNPLFVVGMSMTAWSHREMMRRLAGSQPLVPGSVAVLGPGADSAEHRYWESDRGPGGRPGVVRVVPFADLETVVAALGDT